MAYDLVSAERDDADSPDLRAWSSACAPAPIALLADLRLAQRFLRDDPDAAGLLLDGVLWRIVALVFARAGLAPPSCDKALPELEHISPPVAWRLRLALRAPHPHARLVHARALLDAIAAQHASVIAAPSPRFP
ncbi:MAG: hypothetical protein ACRDHE_02570 [Ktedonobacterales bacterium]